MKTFLFTLILALWQSVVPSYSQAQQPAGSWPRNGILGPGATSQPMPPARQALPTNPVAVSARTTAAWTAVASLTLARGQHAAAALNNKIYVWGGYIDGVGENSSLEMYDIATGTWSVGAALPAALRGHAHAVGSNGLLYSFSGVRDGVRYANCYRYNPTTNTWAAIAAIPVDVWEARAATGADGRIYVFGGENNLRGNQIYNPITNTWTTGAAIPGDVLGAAVVTDGSGLIHVIGGANSSYSALVSHYVYNTTTNTWTTAAALPIIIAQAGATLGADGKIYVVGGKNYVGNNSSPFFNSVYVYTPATNTWATDTPLPITLGETKAVAVGTDLYVLAGCNGTFQSVAYRTTTVTTPTVTTTPASNIMTTSAVLGGSVTTDGTNAVTGRGVVYSSTNTTPSIGGSNVVQATNGATTGTFSATIPGLTPGTTYYVRAYAISSVGNTYGSAVSFTTTPNAPVVITPANNSSIATTAPTYSGTAQANSTVTIYVDGTALSTTAMATGGAFSLPQPTALLQGSHIVYATATIGSSAASDNSPTNTFTVDTVLPTVVSLASSAGSATSTAPIPFAATFSEPVTSLLAGGITVANGTVTGNAVSGSGSGPYSFSVTPTANGPVTVSINANAVQDAAGNGNTASSTVSVTYTAPIVVTTWTGASGTDWFTAGNWSAGVPTATTDAVVPTGVRFYPVIASGTAPTRNLTFASATTLTQSAGTVAVNGDLSNAGIITRSAGTITVTGTLTNSGTINQSAGDITVGGSLTNNSAATLNLSAGTLEVRGDLTNNGTFNPTNAGGTAGATVILGATAQTNGPNILGSSAIRFWNLTVQANGVRLSTSAGASVRRALTLNGNVLTQGNPFIIESASTGDALVVNNGGVVTGTATVQRYITPSSNSGLGYRHYSAPVSNSTVADLMTNGFSPVVNLAYNTSATPNMVTPFPTVFGYDQSRLSLTNSITGIDKGYFSPAATTDALTVGQGYTVNIAANQLVDFQGTLNNGDVPMTLTSIRPTNADGGWQLLGNPYPSPLDYRLVATGDRQGLEAALYVFQSTSQYAGQYRTFINNIGNSVLAMGQAFFVRVENGLASASLNFRNSQRLTAPNATTFQRTAETRPLVQLTLQNAAGTLNDETHVYFQAGASAGFDTEFDGVKLTNPSGLNLASESAGKQLAISGLPLLGNASLTVPLSVRVPATGTYVLNAAQLLNLTGTNVYLRDVQLNALIDLSLQPTYSFTQVATNFTPRFELVFGQARVLSTASASLAAQVSLYPNPAHTSVAVELPESLRQQAVQVSLVDALGRPVRTQTLPAGLATHTLSLADMAAGVYSLRLTTNAGVVIKKLVVE